MLIEADLGATKEGSIRGWKDTREDLGAIVSRQPQSESPAVHVSN